MTCVHLCSLLVLFWPLSVPPEKYNAFVTKYMYRTITWFLNFSCIKETQKHLIATLTRFDDKLAASMVEPDPVGTVLPSSFLKNNICSKSKRQSNARSVKTQTNFVIWYKNCSFLYISSNIVFPLFVRCFCDVFCRSEAPDRLSLPCCFPKLHLFNGTSSTHRDSRAIVFCAKCSKD